MIKSRQLKPVLVNGQKALAVEGTKGVLVKAVKGKDAWAPDTYQIVDGFAKSRIDPAEARDYSLWTDRATRKFLIFPDRPKDGEVQADELTSLVGSFQSQERPEFADGVRYKTTYVPQSAELYAVSGPNGFEHGYVQGNFRATETRVVSSATPATTDYPNGRAGPQ